MNSNNIPFRLRSIAASVLAFGMTLPASAVVFSPLANDITEPAGTYLPLATNSIRADVKMVLGTGACVTDNYVGCTLTDVNADTNNRDDFEPEIKVHIIMDTFPDDGKVSNATLRQRGNSSRFANQKSYRIKLDSKDDLWRGERKFQLNKHPWDLSRVANKLSFDLIQDIPHLPSLRTDFINMYLDDVDYGLFTHVENVGKEYLKRRGWDKDSGVYKADHFDFYQNEAYLLDDAGKPVDPQWFNSKLKIKRGKKHHKLVEMIGAVNDTNNNFSTAVMEKYFNKNNYLSWLSVNFLFGNIDAVGINADNFYLLNKKGEDTFYFLPWDYDEAWLESPWEIQNNLHQSRAWSGVSAYWSSLLHQRYLKQPGAIAELREAVIYIKNNHVTPAKIASKLNAYIPMVHPLVKKTPDITDLPVSGSTPTIEEYLSNYNKMYTAVDKNYQNFIDSIQYPMGFWIETAKLTSNKLTLKWSPSYDLQGDNISYDIEIATKPEFSASSIVKRITGLTTTNYVYDWNLPEAFYYVRILARDSADPINHWQVAFNEYISNDREYHGVMKLQDADAPIDPPTEEVLALCEVGVDPQVIRPGEGTALWWWTENATQGSINNGVGNITIPSDYKWLTPAQTTTYTMTAVSSTGANTSCQTTVVVEGAATANPPVCEMGADPQIIRHGQGTALWWWSENATSATVNNGIGSVAVPSNYKWFNPTRTTTYTMTTQGADGTSSTCSTTITVN